MTPKRPTLPLLFLILLSAAAVFFYSHLNTVPIAVPDIPNPNASRASAFPLRSSSRFTLLIKVLAFNRLDSLSRCLTSLSAADYLSDTVHLHIYIDHFPLVDNSSTLDHDLENSRRISDFVDGFRWGFGDKIVHYRTRNAGLQAQWLESWWPSSDDEFAFVVEDDLEVSPAFYKFVRAVILNYYYDPSNFSPSIFGVTLQRARFVPGKHGNKIKVDSGTRVFLYQLVGTWGQILFPRPWKEFRRWYDDHKAKDIKPLIDGMVTTGWYKRLGEKIWTPWFIKFIHSRGYFNIYTNFLQERALSVSHRDTGVNYAKTAGPDSELLGDKSIDFNNLGFRPLNNLKWYDFCFQEIYPGRIMRTSRDLASILPSVQRNQTIILTSLSQVSESVTRNLLCHFERLNIRNYILVGSLSDFLIDLARRGHPVIDADKFLGDVGVRNLINSRESGDVLVKEILVKAFVAKKCMELKFNVLMVDATVVPNNNYLLPESADLSSDLTYGKNLGFLFLRYSSFAQKHLADAFVQEAKAVVGTLRNKNPLVGKNKSVLDMVVEALERKQVKIKRVDDASFAVNIIDGSMDGSTVLVQKKILYWSNDADSDLIQRRLAKAGMWSLDSDSSCTAVVCHQS